MSNRYSLNKEDGKKIAKGAVIAILGAILTYASQTVSSTDFGTWTPLIVAGSSILINAGLKFTSGK